MPGYRPGNTRYKVVPLYMTSYFNIKWPDARNISEIILVPRAIIYDARDCMIKNRDIPAAA